MIGNGVDTSRDRDEAEPAAPIASATSGAPPPVDIAGEPPRRWRPTQRHMVPFGLVVFALLLHRGWLSTGTLAFGDWHPTPDARLREFLQMPQAWLGTTGLGSPNSTLSGAPYEFVLGVLSRLGLSYPISQRLLFFLPAAVVPFLAMYVLAARATASLFGRVVASLLYGANTYILIVSTNQMTIAMAYALTPLAIASGVSA